jgi:hypothetical protein
MLNATSIGDSTTPGRIGGLVLPFQLPTSHIRALSSQQKGPASRAFPLADARTRTGDPFITSEVLYQLSYVGAT